jgi:hypothetical protein
MTTASKSIVLFQKYLGENDAYAGIGQAVLYQIQAEECCRWTKFLKKQAGRVRKISTDEILRQVEESSLPANREVHTDADLVRAFLSGTQPDAKVGSDDVSDIERDGELQAKDPGVILWPTHESLQKLCREGILQIQKITDPCLDENYDLVVALCLLAGHVLQRAWRFNALCRFSLKDISKAFAHKDKLWLDTSTKGCHMGIVLSHPLSMEFFEICQIYADKWRCLVDDASVNPELLLLQNGTSLLHSKTSSRELMSPAFSSSIIRALSNTEIRKIQVWKTNGGRGGGGGGGVGC